MREVEVSAFVPTTVDTLDRQISPATLIELEGTFTVATVEEKDSGVVVTGKTRGMTASFEFTELDDGFYYEQRGASGPFETMETTVTWESEEDGTQVTSYSSVSLGLPLESLTDRIAAWKRRGELNRLLDGITESVDRQSRVG